MNQVQKQRSIHEHGVRSESHRHRTLTVIRTTTQAFEQLTSNKSMEWKLFAYVCKLNPCTLYEIPMNGLAWN